MGPGELTPGIPLAEYAARRSALAEAMPADSVVLLPSKPEQFYSMDIPNLYRQHTELLYFTGCQEPDAALVLHKDGASRVREIMFVRRRDVKRELWDGPMVGTDDARAVFGVSEALGIEMLGRAVADMIGSRGGGGGTTLFLDPTVNDGVSRAIGSALDAPHALAMRAPTSLVQPIRLRKSDNELAVMRRAARVGGEAFIDAMTHASHPGRLESDVAARLEYGFRVGGAQRPAFPTVVAAGNNACTLHYVSNASLMQAGEFVMVDAGCELHGYCSDISRSWPVSGEFTPPQRELYELVLDAHRACVEAAREGHSAAAASSSCHLDELHRMCVRRLTAGLKELGFFRGASVDEAIYSGRYTRYFPHALGHYLGMDTHDTHQLEKYLPFRAGMVITVEPGVYVRRDDEDAPAAFRGIGMRVEDDVVIRGGGAAAEVMTEFVPKAIDDVEALLRSRSAYRPR